MIVENSQQTIYVRLPEHVKNVGLKISGGADSAIVAYILGKYVKEERPDLTIIPITINFNGRAYQEEFSKKVITFVENEFGIKFGEHKIGFCPSVAEFNNYQKAFMDAIVDKKEIDILYYGVTKNPPDSVLESFPDSKKYGPKDDRTPGNKPTKDSSRWAFTPLINIDKRGVKEIYDSFNLMDRLFPLTRSCEAWTTDFSKHCEECWWCHERHWGFGRYE